MCGGLTSGVGGGGGGGGTLIKKRVEPDPLGERKG